mmetsp:Transcript_23050/g.30060  ORF Transcript_23050/g.30060 Transcript_23050/m.30060 type:complete len:131 (-) Transcript_23050:1424-1816(-)
MAGKMSTFTKKRIFADVRELKEDASSEYVAEPLEDNIFEWHFTIKGPKGTDFEGGIYHGRILLPTDYPFKPPNIVFLTVSFSRTSFFLLLIFFFQFYLLRAHFFLIGENAPLHPSLYFSHFLLSFFRYFL